MKETTNSTKSTKAMTKFESILTQNFSEIKRSRANLLCDSAKTTQEKLVNDKKAVVLKLKRAIDNLTDLAPSTITQLKLDNFNAEEWVNKLQELRCELYEAEIELDIAQKTYDEFFVESEEE